MVWLVAELLSLYVGCRTLVGMLPVEATYSELELETCEELLGITSLVLLLELLSPYVGCKTLVGIPPVEATSSELELKDCEELLGIASLVLLELDVGRTMLDGMSPVELRYGSVGRPYG